MASRSAIRRHSITGTSVSPARTSAGTRSRVTMTNRATGALQVRHPHRDLVRGVVGSGGVDHELGRVRGHRLRHRGALRPTAQDLPASVQRQHDRGDEGQRPQDHPPPGRHAGGGQQQAESRDADVGDDRRGGEVLGRDVGGDARQVGDEADLVDSGPPQQRTGDDDGDQQTSSETGRETGARTAQRRGEGDCRAGDQQGAGHQCRAQGGPSPVRGVPPLTDQAQHDTGEEHREEHQSQGPSTHQEGADARRTDGDGGRVDDQIAHDQAVRVAQRGVSHRSLGSSRSGWWCSGGAA